ncbi:MAG: hypothetical protein IJV98_02060 [Clostridia bacterium]|nr:hypothetical protein [Clostridia bacterium]
MAVSLRYPKITATGEREQLAQIKSYLFGLVGELQAALDGRDQGDAIEYGPDRGSLADGAKALGELKSLIIRSADIVDAYTDQIAHRLEGAYVAQSAFGTYTEKTAQELTANATALESVFSHVSTLDAALDSVQSRLTRSDAYIRSGLLCYREDGSAVYGLEVGQRTVIEGEEVFDKYARFTAERLSFYDRNGSEVAYISDYKLYITSAQVSGTLTLGSYAIETADGLAFRWQ